LSFGKSGRRKLIEPRFTWKIAVKMKMMKQIKMYKLLVCEVPTNDVVQRYQTFVVF